MTKEAYINEPQAVEIHRVGTSTDIILRQNITQVTKTQTDGDTEITYTVWECDEVQYRYPGTLSKDTIEADFDTWWSWEPEDTSTPSVEDDMDAMLVDHEYRLTLLELGVTETE